MLTGVNQKVAKKVAMFLKNKMLCKSVTKKYLQNHD
jgi:hypothetical protein